MIFTPPHFVNLIVNPCCREAAARLRRAHLLRSAVSQRNGQEQKQEGNQQTEGQAQDADGDGSQKQRRPQWTGENGNIKPIGKWKGVEFLDEPSGKAERTDEQKRDYLEGKTIKLEGVPDKQGVPSTMYLRFSPEKGRPLTYANDPDKAVTKTPASESQTQVAVNSEGKTRSASRRVTLATSKNEQTKGVKEPLQQSQTAPKDTKQMEQQDNAVKQDKTEKI